MRERGGVVVWVLAFVASAGIGMGLLVGIGCAVGANACPFTERDPVTTTDGRPLWLANCAACHGRQAEGTENAPTLVSGPITDKTRAELVAVIRRGKPLAGMPSFKNTLTQQQLESVAQFVIDRRGSS